MLRQWCSIQPDHVAVFDGAHSDSFAELWARSSAVAHRLQDLGIGRHDRVGVLGVTWRPISLKIKNDAQPDSPFYDAVVYSHGLLRVLESVRATEGDGPLEELLAEAGLDPTHAAAFDDESWDAVINASASSDP